MKYSSIVAKSKDSVKIVAKWNICGSDGQERVGPSPGISLLLWLEPRATCEGGQVAEGWTGYSLSEVGGTGQALLIRLSLVLYKL